MTNLSPGTSEALLTADPFIVEIEPAVVRYLGPIHSYSDIMARVLFGTEADSAVKRASWKPPYYQDHPNFSEVTAGIYHAKTERLNVGILPVENTKTSTVQEVTDALLTGEFNILGEGSLLIDLVLAGDGDSVNDVRTIYSQSKPFGQATKLLRRRDFTQEHVESTSAAAEFVHRKGPTVAALCSRRAALHYDLNVIEDSVQDDPNNQTRFLIVASRKGPRQPDLEMLKPGGRLGAEEQAVVSGIVSPTKPAVEDGFLRAMNQMHDMNIWYEQEGRRNSQQQPAGGDRDYLIRFTGQPKNLWDVFKEERSFRDQMKFRLLGVYAVGKLYAEAS